MFLEIHNSKMPKLTIRAFKYKNCTSISRKADRHPVTFVAILKKSFNYSKQKTNPLNFIENLIMHDNQLHLFWGQEIPLTTTINVAPLTYKN